MPAYALTSRELMWIVEGSPIANPTGAARRPVLQLLPGTRSEYSDHTTLARLGIINRLSWVKSLSSTVSL